MKFKSLVLKKKKKTHINPLKILQTQLPPRCTNYTKTANENCSREIAGLPYEYHRLENPNRDSQ